MQGKDLINRKKIIIVLISSLLITFIYQFHLQGYFCQGILPFIILLISYLIIFHDTKKNKKAYLIMIPLILIMISSLFIEIDVNNKYLNFFIIPILLSIMFFLLLNKNYSLKGNIINWIFKLFPQGLFTNLKYLKLKDKNYDHQKISNILKGIGFGLLFGVIIVYLLIEADDYFKAFLLNIIHNIIDFNPLYIGIFIGSFILIFSILINLLKNQDTKMSDVKIYHFDKTIIITFLSIINSVFALFLLSEISKLTNNFLEIPMEYTYSSYAREGFFQLLGVTSINYITIMYLLYKTNLVKENKVVKTMLIILMTFSILLIFNSYYRMYLYINHYGFTILRCQVILFLLMELIMFILLLFKVFNHFKTRNTLIYFIIITSFYILNLYLCSNWLINLLN